MGGPPSPKKRDNQTTMAIFRYFGIHHLLVAFLCQKSTDPMVVISIKVLQGCWVLPSPKHPETINYSDSFAPENRPSHAPKRKLVSYSKHAFFRGKVAVSFRECIYLLGQWLNFKLFGITIFSWEKNRRSNFFFQGVSDGEK